MFVNMTHVITLVNIRKYWLCVFRSKATSLCGTGRILEDCSCRRYAYQWYCLHAFLTV